MWRASSRGLNDNKQKSFVIVELILNKASNECRRLNYPGQQTKRVEQNLLLVARSAIYRSTIRLVTMARYREDKLGHYLVPFSAIPMRVAVQTNSILHSSSLTTDSTHWT